MQMARALGTLDTLSENYIHLLSPYCVLVTDFEGENE